MFISKTTSRMASGTSRIRGTADPTSLYQGTMLESVWKAKAHGFRCSSDGMLGPGIYVSRSIDKALRFPLNPEGKVKKIDRQAIYRRCPGMSMNVTRCGFHRTAVWCQELWRKTASGNKSAEDLPGFKKH